VGWSNSVDDQVIFKLSIIGIAYGLKSIVHELMIKDSNVISFTWIMFEEDKNMPGFEIITYIFDNFATYWFSQILNCF